MRIIDNEMNDTELDVEKANVFSRVLEHGKPAYELINFHQQWIFAEFNMYL